MGLSIQEILSERFWSHLNFFGLQFRVYLSICYIPKEEVKPKKILTLPSRSIFEIAFGHFLSFVFPLLQQNSFLTPQFLELSREYIWVHCVLRGVG